jgi:hypothetical protein
MSPKAPNTNDIADLDPKEIRAENNVRFGLQEASVEKLMGDITDFGGVHTPVEVEPLEKPVNGQKYRLTVGFCRHEAVTRLNKEGAGLKLPAIIATPENPLARLRRQISENVMREQFSPMDAAKAIKSLLDLDVPRVEIRKLFSRPGGRKGNVLQPASNSYLNMMVSFLGLPKAVQARVHDGRLPISAAHALTKVEKGKQEEVLAKAEEDRLAQFEREEREEEKLLNSEKKAAEKVAAVEETKQSVVEAEQALAQAQQLIIERKNAVAEAEKLPLNYLQLEEAEKRVIDNKLKSAKADYKGAEKVAKQAKATLDKLKDAAKKITEKAKAPAKAKAKKPAKKAKKVRAQDVEKAAATVTGSAKRLTIQEAVKLVQELAGMAAYPTVMAIGAALRDVFLGEAPADSLSLTLANIVKEPQRPKGKK